MYKEKDKIKLIFFGFNFGDFLNNSDGNGLFHISDGKSS